MARMDDNTFRKTHRATKKDVANGDAKTCTRNDCACGNTPMKLDAFYKDSSMKDGRATWCKLGERDYNKGYYARLRDAGVTRLRDVDATPAKKKRVIASAKDTGIAPTKKRAIASTKKVVVSVDKKRAAKVGAKKVATPTTKRTRKAA